MEGLLNITHELSLYGILHKLVTSKIVPPTFRPALHILATYLLTRWDGIKTRRAFLTVCSELLNWRLQTGAETDVFGKQRTGRARSRVAHVLTQVVITR